MTIATSMSTSLVPEHFVRGVSSPRCDHSSHLLGKSWGVGKFTSARQPCRAEVYERAVSATQSALRACVC